MFKILFGIFLVFLVFLVGWGTTAYAETFTITSNSGTKLNAQTVAEFDNPWAMTFLPDNTLLVTTKGGQMWRVKSGKKYGIVGVPKVEHGGQGGLGDIIIHPDFEQNRILYFSYVEKKDGKFGAVVNSAELVLGEDGGELRNMQRIWTQTPKTAGRGHFAHRLTFSEDNRRLFVTSGDRQQQAPAQDMNSDLGKIIRINPDGSIPDDNPWADGRFGEAAKSFWSVGHRNNLGIDLDEDGRIWVTEMGPRHGDELNLITKGKNYGWPIVSEGKQYSGARIPNHDTKPEFEAPAKAWVPSIAPAGLIIYKGGLFDGWRGNAIIAGLVSRALIRVGINGEQAEEIERFEWQKRIREVEQNEGVIWVLEDRRGGRLLKLTPKK